MKEGTLILTQARIIFFIFALSTNTFAVIVPYQYFISNSQANFKSDFYNGCKNTAFESVLTQLSLDRITIDQTSFSNERVRKVKAQIELFADHYCQCTMNGFEQAGLFASDGLATFENIQNFMVTASGKALIKECNQSSSISSGLHSSSTYENNKQKD